MTKPSILSSTLFDIISSISRVWDDTQTTLSLDELATQGNFIMKKCLDVASHAYEAINQSSSESIEEQYLHYQIMFNWMEEVKHFLMAWRDVTFEQYKGQLELADKFSDEQMLIDFKQTSKEIIDAAKDELIQSLETYQKIPTDSKSRIKREVKRWSSLKNPYLIYRKQITNIAKQITYCQESYQKLSVEQDVFYEIEKLIKGNIQQIEDQLLHLAKILRQLLNDIDKQKIVDVEQQLKIVKAAESTINFDNLQTGFNAAIEELEEKLPIKIELPMATQAGMVTRREVPMRRLVNNWILSEITPLLYEIWEIRDSLTTGAKMVFVNLKNQLNILAAQKASNPNTGETFLVTAQISNTFLGQLNKRLPDLEELSTLIHNRLSEHFRLSHIFKQEEFLPVETQAAINQLIFNESSWASQLALWWDKQRQRLEDYQQTLKHEDALSISEKVVRYINHKRGQNENTYYRNIFLTKGYVGEAFWVGRENKIERVKQVIENWEAGYRGAILITGSRMSGKSLFGEMVANQFFNQKTLHLFPNTKIRLGENIVETTYDLGKALHEIKKYTQGKPYLIWIDNLEMWWNTDISVNKNIRRLKKFIDSFGHEMFFIVATSDAFKAHISPLHEIGKVFQAEIELKEFPLHDLEQAISIRHGATHKMLVDEKGEQLSQALFKKVVKRIHKNADGNIGEALRLWCNAIHIVDELYVSVRFEDNLVFPDIFNSRTATLLTSIVLQKRTNEFRLTQLFGPAYNQKYASIVRRLLGIGVLTQKMDGLIEINELVVHEVVEILKRKKYLL